MRTAGQWSPGFKLALLAAISLAPLLLAWLLSSGRLHWQPGQFTNHGEFVQPPLILQFQEVYENSEPIKTESLRGHWSLLSVNSGVCAERCRYALTATRNALLALGKNVLRFQRLVLTETDSETMSFLASQVEVPRPRVLHASVDAFPKLVKQLPGVSADGTADPLILYVIDPAGRLIMRFSPATEFVGLVADLKRLLAASSQG